VVDEGKLVRPVVVVVAVKQPTLPTRRGIRRIMDRVERDASMLESNLFDKLDSIQSVQYGPIVVTKQEDDLTVEFFKPVE
jgi:hypothetical protein